MFVKEEERLVNECDDSGPRNADSVPNFVGFGPTVDRNLREKKEGCGPLMGLAKLELQRNVIHRIFDPHLSF